MNHQQPSQLPSLFQGVGFPSSFPPLGQSIPQLYRNSFPGTGSTSHSFFLPSLFSTPSQNMGIPSTIANHLYNGGDVVASQNFYASQTNTTTNCIDVMHYPMLPMFTGFDPSLMSTTVRPSPLTMGNVTQRNNSHSINACSEQNSNPYTSPPMHNNDIAHQSPTSSLSSLSAEAKHSDKSPFAQPGGPGSQSDVNSLTGNSPLNIPTTSPAGSRHGLTNNRTPSITGASPQAPTPSPSLMNDISSKKQINSSPKLLAASMHSSPVMHPPSVNNLHSNLVHYSTTQNFPCSNLNLHGNTVSSMTNCVSLPSIPNFDPTELEQNIFTNNIDPSLTTAVDEALSVLGKDVNLDLDAIAPNVNHQFWEDLGDSVLDDALLGPSTSVDVSNSLLHSVFEFNPLNSTSFDDMVSPPNAGPSCSFVEPGPSSPPSHHSSGVSTMADASMTPKLKEKMKRKEREIAELDSAIARHFNMVVERNERNSSDTMTAAATNINYAPGGDGGVSCSSKTDETNFSAFACYSSDLYFAGPKISIDAEPIGNASPVRFSPVSDTGSVDENEKISFSTNSSLFIPITDELDGSIEPSTSATTFTTSLTLQQQQPSSSSTVPKWAPRKSKKIPIYKQNSVVGTSKNNLSSKKSQQHTDSPYCFTDEDEEEEISPKFIPPVVADDREPSTPVENVKEKLVEEEVNRKLLQISSLHPELRLAAIKDGVKNSDGVKFTNASTHANNFGGAQKSTVNCNPSYVHRTPTNVATSASEQFSDLLRHVVPKKRLSASNRGNVVCTDMTPKNIALNFNCLNSSNTNNNHSSSGATSSSSVGGGVLSRTSALNYSTSSFSSNVSCSTPLDNSKLDTFVKTEIIPDTDTAKPYSCSTTSRSSIDGIKIPPDPTSLKNSIDNDEPSTKPLEPLKPKLIIRIPKQCLTNVKFEKCIDDDDGDNDEFDKDFVDDNCFISRSSKKHKHKHKHKKKHKKERQSFDDAYDESKKEDKKKKRRSSEFISSATTSSLHLIENGEVSTKKRKRFIISSESDECRSSFSGDDCLASPTKICIRGFDVSANEKSNDANCTKNRKKERWLHSQSSNNSNVANFSVDGVAVGPDCSLTNGTSSFDLIEAVQKPLLSQTAVFQKGAFVVCKEDLTKNDCPLWKVDSQNLLQKFVPIEKEGKIVYQGSSTYAGWCVQNQEQYVAVQVKFLHFTRVECVVELESSLLDLFPAVSTEITDNVEVVASCSSNDHEVPIASADLNHPLKDALHTYVRVLILHCILGNYLQTLRQQNDIEIIKQLNEVDIANYDKKKKLASKISWTKKFEEALEWYPYCMVNEDDGSGLHCQACERNVVENVLQLFANEGYDFDTLEARPPKTTVSGSPLPSQDFHVCPSCADVAILYHKLVHMRYHLFKKCVDKVDLIRGDNRSMDAKLTVEQCFRHNNWILTALLEYLHIWSKIS